MLSFVPLDERGFDLNLKDETMSTVEAEYKSPVRKILAMLKKGRDNWKAKYQQVKHDLRSVQQQNRAVEKSREQWKARAISAEAELKKTGIRTP